MSIQQHSYVLAAAVLLALVSCRAPALPESSGGAERIDFSIPPVRSKQTLGAGDLVSVVVRGHLDLTIPEGIPLDPTGHIRLPLVGSVALDNLTLDEAEARVKAALATYIKEPDVTLNLLLSTRTSYFVFGAVRRPLQYPLSGQLNAYQALALAGGIMPGGDRASVCLLREGGGFLDVHVFDARTPNESGLVPVHPGDLMFVRLTGSGRFREQVLPVLQGVAPALGSLVNLGFVADALND